ncbi:LysR substrate-binding domain-containing protein [Paenalcaligenes sp. Me131]|uniref:LysR substrate-binding domain-containing protein n=1 Tax=Paenalcaligenes sp. Me131 TaxID=3392636 RepID=UPI003D2C6B4F
MTGKITLRLLEGFRAVMQAKTVTAAALVLNVSQPVVTRLIRDLEENIGFSLFVREQGRLKPTAEAVILYEEVQRSLISVDRILQSVEMLRDGHQGYLQIAAAPALALSFLPKMMAGFSAQYPGARLTLHMHGSETALNMVLSGMCDIAVVMLSMRQSGTYGERILSGRMVCALPVGHRLIQQASVGPWDLKGETFLSHPHVLDTRLQIDGLFAAHGIQREMRLESQISYSLIELVAAGAGVALVDPLTATLYRGDGVVFVPFDPIVVNHYSVVTSSERPPSVLQERFIEQLKTSLYDTLAPEYRVVGG